MAQMDYSQYLDPNSRPSASYVLRNRYSSTVVTGNPVYGQDTQKTAPSSKSVAISFADDIAFILVGSLIAGHAESGKPFNKIFGALPTWAKTITEFAIKMDFAAGHSYKPIPGSPGWSGAFAVLSANRIRKIVSTAALAGSVLMGTMAHAQDMTPIQQSSSVLRSITNQVASAYDKDPLRANVASNMLYETAVHESGLLKHKRQLIEEGGHLVERGYGRSVFMIEASTAKNLIHWAGNKRKAINLLTEESGISYKKLSMMSRQEVGDYLMKNDKFAAAIARLKYASVPGRIPATIEGRASYWSKYYQGTSDPRKQREFLSDNRKMAEEVKAGAISKVVGRHIQKMPKHYGIVQRMHNNKIGHGISSMAKKLAMRSF